MRWCKSIGAKHIKEEAHQRTPVHDGRCTFPEEPQTKRPSRKVDILKTYITVPLLAGLCYETTEGTFWRSTAKYKTPWFKEVEPNVFVMVPDPCPELDSALKSFHSSKKNKKAAETPYDDERFKRLDRAKVKHLFELLQDSKMPVLRGPGMSGYPAVHGLQTGPS